MTFDPLISYDYNLIIIIHTTKLPWVNQIIYSYKIPTIYSIIIKLPHDIVNIIYNRFHYPNTLLQQKPSTLLTLRLCYIVMKKEMEINKTKEFFFYIAQKVYLLGAPNYWSEDLKLPNSFYKIHDYLFSITDFIVTLFISSEWLALFTQKNLTYKQSADLVLCVCSHPILHMYTFNMKFYKDKIR